MWIFFTLLAAILFAASSMVNKLAMVEATPTDRLLPGTFLAGFLLLLIYGGQKLPPLEVKLVAVGLGLSLFSMLNCVAILLALRRGPVGPVAAIAGSHSVLTPVLAWLIFAEKLAAGQWVAVGLATAGMVLVQLNRTSGQASQHWLWVLLAFLGASGSTGETLLLDHAGRLPGDGVSGLIWSYLFSFIFTSLWFLRRRQRAFKRPFLLGATDGILSATGMIFFAKALTGGPAGLVAALSTSAVVFRALGGRLFFGDQLSPFTWFGISLAAGAFALVSLLH